LPSGACSSTWDKLYDILIKKNKKDHQFNPKTILYQNYKHYDLPVTLNPLNYRTLIHFYKSKNMYLVQIRPSIFAKITKS